jgi:hypothetical protein
VKYLVVLLSLLILTSCSPPEVHPNKLVERNGVTYQVNSDKPFTGSSVRRQDNGEVRKTVKMTVLLRHSTATANCERE